jgi:hypothetical protein
MIHMRNARIAADPDVPAVPLLCQLAEGAERARGIVGNP